MTEETKSVGEEQKVDKVEETELQEKDGSSEKREQGKDGSNEKKERVKNDRNEPGKDNVIFVGIKPFMNYVTGVVMQFQNKGQNEVFVSARGKFTSKAIDIVEVARRTFLKDENIQIKNISVSSEQFENKEGKRIFVSAIEIRLVKG